MMAHGTCQCPEAVAPFSRETLDPVVYLVEDVAKVAAVVTMQSVIYQS
jgi:hypothetical protein